MIKTGDIFITTNDADLTVSQISHDGTVAKLSINGWWFDALGVKELRKFLKKLQRQLEQAELENLD